MDAVQPAKYNADGTGRDTYIRRDPIECFGKNLYKSEPRPVTRFGAAGSVVPRPRGRKPGEFDPVGGHLGKEGGFDFSRPARFLRAKSDSYPVEVTKWTTMKQLTQDAHVTSCQEQPGHLNHISGHMGFHPRTPPASVASTEWADVGPPPF
uniref:Uncharacterized protein n=1 Tax=Haptolina brevifila TaxID=156173 RepID=A0A7S2N020_9EUKA